MWDSLVYLAGEGGNTIIITDAAIEIEPVIQAIEIAPIVQVIEIIWEDENGTIVMSSAEHIKFTIKQGDTSPVVGFKFKDIAVALCTCRQVVRRDFNADPVIDLPVTDTGQVASELAKGNTDDFFLVGLPPGETAKLAPGSWIWAVELDCPSTSPVPLKQETHITLVVADEAVEAGS